MTITEKARSELSINTIRTLTLDSVEKAQHGHAGMPLGAAPMAYTLWKNYLSVNPLNPTWANRDRFVLSAGHGSNLLYNLLHLTGFDITIDDLKNTRQWNSKTPGHPEYGHTPGVEATTGPLGQGIPVAVGMALAERYLAEVFNREDYPIVDHFTYTICGDGDLMEGVSYEAASLAGHLGLGRLIVLYDSNDISLDGDLQHSFSEDIQKRFESMHWQYIRVEDGNDITEIKEALNLARIEELRPTLIEVKTVIGYGSPSLQGTHKAHSNPFGKEEIKRTKKHLGWNFEEEFYVPDEVYEDFRSIRENGIQKEKEWNQLLAKYEADYPIEAHEFKRIVNRELPDKWDGNLPNFAVGQSIATRASASKVLNSLADRFPELVGGAADLHSSTLANLIHYGDVKPGSYGGRNVWFGVREFAMGAIANGMALHYLKPFVSTFFVFSDYLRPAIRLAALMKLPVTYVFTHDSVAVGADGPTHQPVEHLASLRAMPGVSIIRPADANEAKVAWKIAISSTDKPTILVLGRQGLPTLKETSKLAMNGVTKGAYVVSPVADPCGIIIATGSEVNLALSAQQELAMEGIYVNVVSMPSWDLFDQQPDEYKETVLPRQLTKRLSVEMGSKIGWKDYVGLNGKVMSIDKFGQSAPGEEVMEKYGFTVDHVVEQFKRL
ncbi:transketolase [Ornithinibacillus sp. BX22]|uniref:Transketolase n=2 Tax=Ornithinibacillus TaxID=484508 RepID=A0A923RJW1_9BACI|nr:MULTISPECIES: transketolase [Ornithinibacillus]MBC5637733.1 transketolase [Ornithinibacillus hominis]MBS3681593.1 transketolase [Ornithinibacillus massiliensis]